MSENQPDEVSEEELSAAEGNEQAVPLGEQLPPFLLVHSRVRRVDTRTVRARQPTRHRFKQYLFSDPSKRLTRKRPVGVSLEEVKQNLDDLLAKEAVGILSVHTSDGRRVNLQALKDSMAALLSPPRQGVPLPKPPLDSVARDTPAGEQIPTYVDGSFLGDPAAQRAVERITAEKAAEAVRQGASEGEAEDTSEAPPAPPPASVASAEEVEEPEVTESAEDPAAQRATNDHKKHKKGRRS